MYEDVARDTNRGHTVAAVVDCFRLAKDVGFKVGVGGGGGERRKEGRGGHVAADDVAAVADCFRLAKDVGFKVRGHHKSGWWLAACVGGSANLVGVGCGYM